MYDDGIARDGADSNSITNNATTSSSNDHRPPPFSIGSLLMLVCQACLLSKSLQTERSGKMSENVVRQTYNKRSMEQQQQQEQQQQVRERLVAYLERAGLTSDARLLETLPNVAQLNSIVDESLAEAKKRINEEEHPLTEAELEKLYKFEVPLLSDDGACRSVSPSLFLLYSSCKDRIVEPWMSV